MKSFSANFEQFSSTPAGAMKEGKNMYTECYRVEVRDFRQ